MVLPGNVRFIVSKFQTPLLPKRTSPRYQGWEFFVYVFYIFCCVYFLVFAWLASSTKSVSQSVDPRARRAVRRSVREHAGLSVSRAVRRLVHAPSSGQSVSRTGGQSVHQLLRDMITDIAK